VAYNTQNYWVFGLCPLFGIPETRKKQRFRNWICFHPQVRRETPALLGPLEKANLNQSYWTMNKVQKPSNSEDLSVLKS
jgi:hypothetical protein